MFKFWVLSELTLSAFAVVGWSVCVCADMRRDIQEIFRATPHSKQVMMFSATLCKDIRPVCKKFMQDVIISPPGWRFFADRPTAASWLFTIICTSTSSVSSSLGLHTGFWSTACSGMLLQLMSSVLAAVIVFSTAALFLLTSESMLSMALFTSSRYLGNSFLISACSPSLVTCSGVSTASVLVLGGWSLSVYHCFSFCWLLFAGYSAYLATG